jgi:hypothetical protein
MRVLGPKGKPIVTAGADALNKSGLIETRSFQGDTQVQIHSTQAGGLLTAVGPEGKIGFLGFLPENYGLFIQTPQTGGVVPISIWPPLSEKKGNPVLPKSPNHLTPQEKQTSQKIEKKPTKS